MIIKNEKKNTIIFNFKNDINNRTNKKKRTK